MATTASTGRTRAYLEFIAAVIVFFLARQFARRAAIGVADEAWVPLAEQAILCVLLVVSYAAFGIAFDRQKKPLSEQGLPIRPGCAAEAGLGIAVGWGAALACVLLLALGGGIAVVLSTQAAAWGWLAVDVVFFLLACLVEEVVFRGYGFQRFALVVGPIGASLGFAAYYAIVQAMLPGSNRVSIVVSVALSLVLSTAYLRSRALWVSWGLNFGWKASRALVFGLTVSGVSSHSSVVEGDPMGPLWLTGGGYGLDGSWAALFMLLATLPLVYRLTRELDFRYNAPVIVPGGIPVDLDAAARRNHEAQMGPAEPATPSLVQIFPAAGPAASNPVDGAPKDMPSASQ